MMLQLLFTIASFQAPIPPPVDAADLPQNKLLPAHLDEEQIARAEAAMDAVDAVPMPRGRTYAPPESTACDFNLMPLDVAFSDYTISAQGQVLQDGGWTAAERDWAASFLCKLMPEIQAEYGPPWQRYTLTIVKDLRYAGTNIFVPSTLSIHMASVTAPQWYPQLFTHELVHAWRGRRTLTMHLGLQSLYHPRMSGLEEGFAQGISYAALNRYAATQGPGDPHVGYLYWGSDTDWDHDFRNDGSMATESLWSESGGTLKFFERYEMGAASILQLRAAAPTFAAEFNAAWYAWVDSITPSEPQYVPTRAEIVALLAGVLPPTLAGIPASDWIDGQRIFDCAFTAGKKLWAWKGWYNLGEQYYRIHFLETYPNGSEWAYWIASQQAYLYHRFNDRCAPESRTSGAFVLHQAWDGQIAYADRAKCKDPNWWVGNGFMSLGMCLIGIGMEELRWYDAPSPPNWMWQVNSPIQPQIEPTGLYRMKFVYRNPHYVAPPGQPAWGIAYDGSQTFAELVKYQLMMTNAEANAAWIAGGVIGVDGGTVAVEHLSVPGIVVEAPVARGLFMLPSVSQWRRSELGGALSVALPGTLRFTYTPPPEVGGPQHVEERLVDWGSSFAGGGRRHVLLGPVAP